MRIKKHHHKSYGLLKVIHLTDENIFEVAEMVKATEFIYERYEETPLGFITRLEEPMYVGNFISIDNGGYCTYWRGLGGASYEIEKEFEKLEDYED